MRFVFWRTGANKFSRLIVKSRSDRPVVSFPVVSIGGLAGKRWFFGFVRVRA